MYRSRKARLTLAFLLAASAAFAQMGRTWPSEKKIVPDPVTGLPLTFLTSSDTYRQSKIYQTHRQWTADGKWLIFRGVRETGSQALAVNEETGLIVQVTETGFSGMLCLSNQAMKLYVLAGGGGWRCVAAEVPGRAAPDSRDRSRQALRRRGGQNRKAGGQLHARLRNHSSHSPGGRQYGPGCQ